MLEHFRAATSWYTVDQEVELTPEYATQVLIDMSDPRSEYFGQLRHESAPPDHIFGRRMEVLTLAVIAQLHATRQLPPDRARVVLRRPAGTELGRQEAEFYARAAESPRWSHIRARQPSSLRCRARHSNPAGDRSLRHLGAASRLHLLVWLDALDLHRLVVPGRPLGSPAVIPTRAPGLTQPSSTTRRAASAISSSVTSWRRIEAACTPHIRLQRRTVSLPGDSA